MGEESGREDCEEGGERGEGYGHHGGAGCWDRGGAGLGFRECICSCRLYFRGDIADLVSFVCLIFCTCVGETGVSQRVRRWWTKLSHCRSAKFAIDVISRWR